MADRIPELPDNPQVDTKRAAAVERAQAALAAMADAGMIAKGESDDTVVAYVAPVEKNTRFLVKPGTPLTVNDPNSPRGKRMYEREGDVWVEFTAGICVLTKGEDDEKIAWCDAHPEICRSAADPMTEAWVYMKEMQIATANRDATLPASIDVEALLRGDPRGSKVAHETVTRARDRAASAKQ